MYTVQYQQLWRAARKCHSQIRHITMCMYTYKYNNDYNIIISIVEKYRLDANRVLERILWLNKSYTQDITIVGTTSLPFYAGREKQRWSHFGTVWRNKGHNQSCFVWIRVFLWVQEYMQKLKNKHLICCSVGWLSTHICDIGWHCRKINLKWYVKLGCGFE